MAIWDADKKTEIKRFTSSPNPISDVSFDPSGKRFYSVSGPVHTLIDMSGELDRDVGGLRAWTRDTADPIFRRKADEFSTYALAMTPDGRRLITGGEDRELHIWDAQTLQHLVALTGQSSPVFDIAVAFDGRLIVSGDKSGNILIWEGRVPTAVEGWRNRQPPLFNAKEPFSLQRKTQGQEILKDLKLLRHLQELAPGQ